MTYIIVQWAQAPETPNRHLVRPACAGFEATGFGTKKNRQKSSNLDARRGLRVKHSDCRLALCVPGGGPPSVAAFDMWHNLPPPGGKAHSRGMLNGPCL